MCIQRSTTGVMVLCMTRVPVGSGGLLRLAMAVHFTWMLVTTISALRLTILGLTVLLSASQVARRYPLSYVFSGYYYWGDGYLDRQDSYGYWWSTAAYSDSGAYYLYMNSSGLYPQSNANKAYGFALRCVSL
ncbi:hypothetical protein IK112_02860 [Candidatus Saccharibacteria bacterium]|nr:hypothetical protein [Candidatus Saccharibacteria bacterium]